MPMKLGQETIKPSRTLKAGDNPENTIIILIVRVITMILMRSL